MESFHFLLPQPSNRVPSSCKNGHNKNQIILEKIFNKIEKQILKKEDISVKKSKLNIFLVTLNEYWKFPSLGGMELLKFLV